MPLSEISPGATLASKDENICNLISQQAESQASDLVQINQSQAQDFLQPQIEVTKYPNLGTEANRGEAAEQARPGLAATVLSEKLDAASKLQEAPQ